MQQVSSMNLAHVAVGHTVQIWILVGPFGKIWQGTSNRIMGKADRRCTARSTFSAEFEQRKTQIGRWFLNCANLSFSRRTPVAQGDCGRSVGEQGKGGGVFLGRNGLLV